MLWNSFEGSNKLERGTLCFTCCYYVLLNWGPIKDEMLLGRFPAHKLAPEGSYYVRWIRERKILFSSSKFSIFHGKGWSILWCWWICRQSAVRAGHLHWQMLSMWQSLLRISRQAANIADIFTGRYCYHHQQSVPPTALQATFFTKLTVVQTGTWECCLSADQQNRMLTAVGCTAGYNSNFFCGDLTVIANLTSLLTLSGHFRRLYSALLQNSPCCFTKNFVARLCCWKHNRHRYSSHSLATRLSQNLHIKQLGSFGAAQSKVA